MLKPLKNEKGISTIELIPVLLLFALLFNFSLGFFGIIHSGILNSIAARNYAFETFRNRANLTYLRDLESTGQTSRYSKPSFRFHGITAEGRSADSSNTWVVTRRPIKFTDLKTGVASASKEEDHQLARTISDTGKASDVYTGKAPEDGRNGSSPVWVKVIYGICLTAKCTPGS